MRRKLTTEEFIEKAQEIHGNKYDYSLTDYKDAKTPIFIICKEHGIFSIRPANHTNQKQGCPKCGKLRQAKTQSLTTEQWIQKARLVHGDKYDYSKVEYTKSSEKVCIICPEHGEFYQIATEHLKGKGCSKCGHIITGIKKLSSTQEFIEKARKVHGDKYNYSSTIYTGVHNKLQIICPEHGSFEQEANSHLHGIGCPKCSCSKGENIVKQILNVNNINYVDQYRVDIDKDINCSGYTYIDFYLPDLNIAIEYNGIQHYVPIEYFGGQLRFEQQKRRDSFVREYCTNSNIKLVEIPYELKDYKDILTYINNYAPEIFIRKEH